MEDQGIRHAYIKRATPQLNGKVERSHRSDEQEFYQLLSYKGDVDLEAKLVEWERFYNFHRPHGAFNGNTPYEALRDNSCYVAKDNSESFRRCRRIIITQSEKNVDIISWPKTTLVKAIKAKLIEMRTENSFNGEV